MIVESGEDYKLSLNYTGMLAPKPTPPTAEQILKLQEEAIPYQQPLPEPEHFYAKGMYGRKFCMKADTWVFGKKHKHQHFMMVLKGRARVVTEFDVTDVEAGLIHVSQPGAKRIVYAIEDTIFATVHLNPTDSQDLEFIESEHIEPETPEMIALADKYRKELLK